MLSARELWHVAAFLPANAAVRFRLLERGVARAMTGFPLDLSDSRTVAHADLPRLASFRLVGVRLGVAPAHQSGLVAGAPDWLLALQQSVGPTAPPLEPPPEPPEPPEPHDLASALAVLPGVGVPPRPLPALVKRAPTPVTGQSQEGALPLAAFGGFEFDLSGLDLARWFFCDGPEGDAGGSAEDAPQPAPPPSTPPRAPQPLVSALRRLVAEPGTVSGKLEAVAGHRHLAELSLPQCLNLDGDLAALQATTHLARLDLGGCDRVTGNVQVLGKLPSLRSLCLRDCFALTGSVDVFATLVLLEDLDLTWVSELEGSLAAFATLTKLETLTCSGCRKLGGDDADALAGLVGLRHLRLRGCGRLRFSIDGWTTLVRLETLDLCECAQLACAMDKLIPHLTCLRRLNLAGVRKTGTLLGGGALEELYL